MTCIKPIAAARPATELRTIAASATNDREGPVASVDAASAKVRFVRFPDLLAGCSE
jgi:hypothetical protein